MGLLFVPRKLLGQFILLFVFASAYLCFASPEGGWIEGQQRDNGAYWSADSSISTPTQSTQESISALILDGSADQISLQKAVIFLSGETVATTESIARRLIAEHSLSQLSSAIPELSNRQNSDGGFGAYDGYESDLLSTAFAVRALGSDGGPQVALGVEYLIRQQNSDGSWTLNSISNIAITSEIILSLADQTRFQGVSAALTSARNFLFNQKQKDNLWGQSFESALAISALTSGVNTGSELKLSVAALQARMNATHNWHGDIYTTALALQAIKRVELLGNSVLGRGTVIGQILIAGSGQPLAGASITVQNTGIQATTDGLGKFTLNNVPANDQTLLISQNGFSSTSAVAQVEDASVVDLGELVLTPQENVGMVRGQVFASGSQQVITGAVISVVGPQQASTLSQSGGNFQFFGLPVGSYSFTINAKGFYQVQGDIVVLPGGSVQLAQPLVSLDTPLNTTPVQLTGTVVDGQSGQVLTAVQILVDGSPVSGVTRGSFATDPIARGQHDIQILAEGYRPVTYQITIPAGASGDLGNLKTFLLTGTQAPESLSVVSTAIDKISGKPISGATITVVSSGASVVTDTAGHASLSNIAQLQFDVVISAPGYDAQQIQLTASAFGSLAATFALYPSVAEQSDWSVSGTITDKTTQTPIVGALLSIDNGKFSVTTDAQGHYSIANLSSSNIGLGLTADSYQSSQQQLQLGSTKGHYVVDLSMTPVAASGLSIVAVNAPAAVQPGSVSQIQIEVENQNSNDVPALVVAKVVNDKGEEIATLLPYLPDTDVLSPHIQFKAGQRLGMVMPWSVKQTAQGNYLLHIDLIAEGSITSTLPRGQILASGLTNIQVEGVALFGGAMNIDPPLLQAGAAAPIKLAALLRNQGNISLSAGTYELTIRNKNTGEIYHTVSAGANSLSQNQIVQLDFGTWIPTTDMLGEMSVHIIRQDGVVGEINGDLYIGDIANASYTLDRSILPAGNSSVRAKVNLTGIDNKNISSLDPLYVLVKDAVTTGADYEGTTAVAWDKSNRCLGCHVQSQSLAGLGAALNKTDIDPKVAKYFLTAVETGQDSNGSIETNEPQHTTAATLVGAWSLTEWPDQSQTYRQEIKALEQLWRHKQSASEGVYWIPERTIGWLSGNTAATSLAALIASRVSRIDPSLVAQVDDYAWGRDIVYAEGAVGDSVFKSAGNTLFVAKVGGRIETIDPASGANSIVVDSIANVRGRIDGIDIDQNGNFWVTTEQSRLINVTPSGEILQNIQICNVRAGNIVIDKQGQFAYVACLEGNIKKVDLASANVEVVASGSQITGPYGLAWAHDGGLLIANYYGYNILKLNTVTGDLSVYLSDIKGLPTCIAVADDGSLFVTVNSMTSGGGSAGVVRVRPDATAEKILWGLDAFGIVIHEGTLYVGGRQFNGMHTVNRVPLDVGVISNYLDAAPAITQYLLNSYDSSEPDNTVQALLLVGLGELRKILPSGSLSAQVDSTISELSALLKQRQAPSGGWGYSGAVLDDQRDPLVTALVGLALEYTSPSSKDPMVRNAITYLLNTQKPNGSWHSNTGIFTTDLGTTGLIMVYMPKALERIGGLDIQLNLQQPANVTLSNPSIAPDSITPNSDGTKVYQWDIKGVTGSGLDLTFDLAVNELELNSVRPVSNSAIMSFSNSFTDGVINSQIAVPSVSASPKQRLNIQTDKTSYSANTPVVINNLVNNLAESFAGGTLNLSIKSSATGDVITSLPVTAVQSLDANGSAQLSSLWNTGSLLAGSYSIYGQLVDTQGKPLAEAVTSFVITPSAAQGGSLITAGLSSDKLIYRFGETFGLQLGVSNLAQNQMLNATLGRLEVLDDDSNLIFTQDVVVPQLIASGEYRHSVLVNLAGTPAGQLHAKWTVYDASGAQLLASANTSFSVEDDPLFLLSGKVNIDKDIVEQGGLQACNYEVNNTGDTELSAVTITRILSAIVSGDEKLSTQDQLNLLPGGQQTYTQVSSTSNYELGDYACILQAQVGDKTKVLATAIFNVKDAPIKLNGALSLGDKGRLLVLVDPQKPELGAYLNNLLTQANWYYTLVDNAGDFEAELNTNSYSVYALFSQTLTLAPSTREQLKANVARGDGLLVADGHDRRHKSLEEALGVRVHAKQALIDGLSVDDSPLGEAWNYSFGYLLNSLTFDNAGASVFGHYQLAKQNPANLAAFGEATDYNLFVLDDFTSMSSTVEGRMAIGGNLNLNNFSVGDKLSSSYHDSVVAVGGDVNFPSGRIYYGSLIAGGSVEGIGDAVRYGMDKKASISGNTEIALNFDAAREYLKALSSNLAKLPANGTVTLQWGNYYNLQGDCQSSLQVFNINAAELANVRTYDVGCIPKNATVVFNILGSTASIQNIGMQSLSDIHNHVLFNFPQATSISLKSVAIEGSILAPYAEIEQPAGRVVGQVIARAWHSTTSGFMSIHNYPFQGNLSAALPASTNNALAYYQYQNGNTLFAGFDLLALAYADKNRNTPQVANPFAQLIVSGLDQVNPQAMRMEPGRAVPLHIQLANVSNQAVDANAQLSMDKSFAVLAAGGFAQNQAVVDHSEWNLALHLEQGEQLDKILYLRLPDVAANDPDVHLEVKTGTEPNVNLQLQQTIRLVAP